MSTTATVALIALYAVGIFPAAVLIGRWAEGDDIVSPYAFGVLFSLFWPLVAVFVVLGLIGRGFAGVVEAASRRIW